MEEELCHVGKQFDSFEEFDNALKSLREDFATLYGLTTVKLCMCQKLMKEHILLRFLWNQ